MEAKKAYFKVLKVMRKSRRRQIIERNLTEDEARRLVKTFPKSNRSMVIYTKQNNFSKAKK